MTKWKFTLLLSMLCRVSCHSPALHNFQSPEAFIEFGTVEVDDKSRVNLNCLKRFYLIKKFGMTFFRIYLTL